MSCTGICSFIYTEVCEAFFSVTSALPPLSSVKKRKLSRMRLELLVDEPSKENTLFSESFMRVYFLNTAQK